MRHKIIDLLIAIVVYTFIATAMHELWHYLAVVWQGGQAYLEMRGFWAGYTHFSGIPYHGHDVEIVYAAGGIGTAILLGLLWWRAYRSPTLWDENHVFVLGILTAMQLALGLAEISLADPINGGRMYAILAPALVALFVIPSSIYFAFRWAKWLLANNQV